MDSNQKKQNEPPEIPFYETGPVKNKRRTKVEIEALESALYTLAEALRPCSVRQLYYQAVAKELIDKTESEYKSVCRILSNMRRAGSLPYHWFADHTRWRHKPDSHGDLADMLNLSRSTYRKALWMEQQRYVEVWIEKAALIGVVLPVTAEWDVPLLPCRGYPSLTYLYEAAEELKEIGKPTSIYYFGDHDPSGCHISVKIEEDLRKFAPEVDLSFERVAVNEHQIAEWNLPTRPTKKTDSRAKNFRGESVELDAIPPQQLRDLVRGCIESNIDQERLERTRITEQLEKETLDSMIDTIVSY